VLKGKNTTAPYLKSNLRPFLKLERKHDSGYQGIKKDFPELKVMIPYKNRKDRNLEKHRKNITKN